MKYPNFWQYKSFLSVLLLPLSQIFYLITKIRKALAKPIRFPALVICIGNISVGGTGKTQVVGWLVRKLLDQNLKIVIVCKGYKGSFKKACIVESKHDASFVGDEAKLLSDLTDVIVARKPKDAYVLLSKLSPGKLSPDIIILDDFLQNPHVIKDFSILVIDADRMFGNARLLPAGPLRQSLQEAMLVTKARVAVGSSMMRPQNLSPNTFFAQITCTKQFDLTKNYVAFAGIGNPDRFFACLKLYGLNTLRKLKFSDHHSYTLQDVAKLKELANKLQAILITTPKDAIKLKHFLPLMVFEPTLKFEAEKDLLRLIYEEIKKNTPSN
jgi:tetraacyldisaccharide 4'-kinase